MRCLSLLFQSNRASNLCAWNGSSPGIPKLGLTSLVAESHVVGLGILHFGIFDRYSKPMGFGLGIMFPGNACRVPSGLSGWVGS